MVQYTGNDEFDIRVGGIEGVFNTQDLNDLLDELQTLGYEYPISERICTSGELEKARDVAFECGVKEGKNEAEKAKDYDYDMCG